MEEAWEYSAVNMKQIVSVEARPMFKLLVRFNDGVSGEVDLSGIIRTGVFARWDEPGFFEKVSADPGSGTVVWPGGLDLDPYVLYSRVSGKPISEVLALEDA